MKTEQRGTSDLPTAIFVMGPTASGKTALAVELAEHFPVDIISVDSALVYRGMDIGTAKPEPEVLARAPHRLIDICDPAEAYSVARFRKDALREMADISQRGRIPLLVGGTMLYYRALQHGLSPLPEADPALRAALEQRMARQGLADLHEQLTRVDPAAAARIHANDPQRVLRALEVWELTGRSLTDLQQEQTGEAMPYRAIKLIRAPIERRILHDRIAERFRQMLLQGFEDEVRALFQRGGLAPDMPSMRSVGYRQMLAYILGESSYEEMQEKGIAATRQLAKRQLTWLRKEEDGHWLHDETGGILENAMLVVEQTLEFPG